MIIEPKIINPLVLRISHHGNEILADENFNKNLPLTPGAIIGPGIFGFTLIVDNNGKQSETTYPTQCSISGVELKNDVLCIYEDHKYIPWKFSKDGDFISEAIFLKVSGKDLQYLADTYGIVGEEEVDKVNTYIKR